MAIDTIDDLIDGFDFLDDWEERYRYLIELGRRCGLPESDKVPANKVEGCVSQVWLVCEVRPDSPPVLDFRVDSDAHIVRGLLALLMLAYSGKPAADILAVDIDDVFERLQLGGHLSPNRRNGFFAVTRHIRAHAQRALAEAELASAAAD